MEVIALTCVRINQGRRQKELATIIGFELPHTHTHTQKQLPLSYWEKAPEGLFLILFILH